MPQGRAFLALRFCVPLRSTSSAITMLLSLAFVSSLVASAVAHATFQELWINGVDQGELKYSSSEGLVSYDFS